MRKDGRREDRGFEVASVVVVEMDRRVRAEEATARRERREKDIARAEAERERSLSSRETRRQERRCREVRQVGPSASTCLSSFLCYPTSFSW